MNENNVIDDELLAQHEKWLSGGDYAGIRLSLKNKNLDNIVLINKKLNQIDFSNSSLRGSNLSFSNFSNCNFTDVKLYDSNLSNADLTGCETLHVSQLAGCDISNTTLPAHIESFPALDTALFTSDSARKVFLCWFWDVYFAG